MFLTTATILKIAYPNEDFVECIDACKKGLSGVFMQNGYAVHFESKEFNMHEKKYATHDLELETIINAFEMWMHYLMANFFYLMIYHSGLNYLFKHPNSNIDGENKKVEGEEVWLFGMNK